MDSTYILFLPFDHVGLLEMMPIAKRVQYDGRYMPLFYLCWSQLFNEDHITLLDNAGIEVYDRESITQKNAYKGKTTFLRVKDYIRESFFMRTLWKMLASARDFWKWQRKAESLLGKKNIAAIIIVSDRVLGWETIFVKAGNRHKVPSLIVPFSLYSPKGDIKNRIIKDEFEKDFIARSYQRAMAKKLFPQMLYAYQDQEIFFSPFYAALPGLLFGILPKNPWTLGGGYATRMAVENKFYHDELIKQGTDKSKMVVTGKPSSDLIYETNHNNDTDSLRGELEIPSGKKVLLCAVPQLAEHDLFGWERHWWEITFLIYTFSRLRDVSIVLSLHPRSEPAEYRPIAKKYGAVIAKRRVHELLPICDVFVATFSTTVMLAIGLGKPAVVIDFYNLDYDVYDKAPGVLVIRNRNELLPNLEKLFYNDEYYRDLAASQKEPAADWITLDGRCTERVVNEIYRMIELSPGT
jgi:hypothetical protein